MQAGKDTGYLTELKSYLQQICKAMKLFPYIPVGCKIEQAKMPALLSHAAWLVSEKHLEKRCVPYSPCIVELKKKKKIQHNYRIMGVLTLSLKQLLH